MPHPWTVFETPGPPGPPGPSGVALAFANPAALAAYNASALTEFSIASCGIVNDTYIILTPSAALLAAVDGVNVIAAAAPSGAVWCRQYNRNIPAQYEAAWFLDAVNGNDGNAGTTAPTALKTVGELCTRLAGATIRQNVVVTLASGNYGSDAVRFNINIEQGFTISMVGSVTASADVISAILPTVVGTAATNVGAQRGTLTATAFNFQAANDRQRLRITSGASAGAMAFITRVVTPGVAGVVNVTRWGRLTNPLTSTAVTNIVAANGDNYSVDTLNTTLGYLDCQVHGPGRLVIQDCIFRSSSSGTVTHRATSDNGSGNGVLLYGCMMQANGATVIQRSTFTIAVSQITSDVSVLSIVQSLIYARMVHYAGVGVDIQSSSVVMQSAGACFDSSSLTLQDNGIFDQIGGTAFDVQFCDGNTSHAIEVGATGQYWAHSNNNQIWGLNNAFTGVSLLVTGRFFYNVKPSIPGGTGNDFTVGATNGAWATLPIIVSTAIAGTAAAAGAGAMAVAV